MTKKCYICDSETKMLKGDFQHTIFGFEVTVKNVPYHECTKCGNSFYDNDQKVDWLVRDAFRSKVAEVEYVED